MKKSARTVHEPRTRESSDADAVLLAFLAPFTGKIGGLGSGPQGGETWRSIAKNTLEGGGNLLDNWAIMCPTEHTQPMSHLTDNIPMVVAGKSGGKFKGGVYFLGNQEKIATAGLTELRAAGVQLDIFGAAGNGEPQTSDTFTALEAT